MAYSQNRKVTLKMDGGIINGLSIMKTDKQKKKETTNLGIKSGNGLSLTKMGVKIVNGLSSMKMEVKIVNGLGII